MYPGSTPGGPYRGTASMGEVALLLIVWMDILAGSIPASAPQDVSCKYFTPPASERQARVYWVGFRHTAMPPKQWRPTKIAA